MNFKVYFDYFRQIKEKQREFGLAIPILDASARIALKVKLYNMANFFANLKNQEINKRLKYELLNIVGKEVYSSENDNFIENKVIWTCWWQGEKQAPAIVEKCIENMKEKANGYEVIVITKENYEDYVSLNPIFLEKMKSGKISLTHFSDILRIALLKEHGGLWLDSTVFLNKNLKDDMFLSPIFMGRERLNILAPNFQTYLTQSGGLVWHLYIFGGCKEYKAFSIIYDFLIKYWKTHDILIDYFLIDYLLYVVYENDQKVKEDIDSVPENIEGENRLQHILDNLYDEQEVNDIFSSKSLFFKLSYKKKMSRVTQNGGRTVYDYLTEVIQKSI